MEGLNREGRNPDDPGLMPARRCPSCLDSCCFDINSASSCIFLVIVAAVMLGVGMQLYLFLNIEAATRSAVSKFVDCTASVQSGVQGLSGEVEALRGRMDDMERALLANVTWQVREILARLGTA